MNSSENPWLSELEVENSILNMDGSDHVMDSFEEEFAAVFGQNFHHSVSAGVDKNSSSSSTSKLIEPEQKQENVYSKFDGVLNPADHQASSTPIILNFGNSSHSEKVDNGGYLNPEEEAAVSEIFKSYNVNSESIQFRAKPKKKKSRVRPPSQTYDHIIAERKRREQLSQLFIALSAIVPGLKKTDKSSVLGDAIKYLKHLQERVEKLEEEAANQTMQSAVLVKKSQIIEEDEGSSDEKCGTSEDQMLPEIEARVCSNNILLRIQCEKHKGVLVNLLSKLDTLDLVVVSSNVIPFGNLALDITIIAEMEKEFSLNVKEVVTVLSATLQPVARTHKMFL
ncbi:hypothetical protein ACJIZ3_014996 [Penstemon smallii]|uniref:BHLH domain-containing protein n=1 Tax=Penstemon smallii TaxID=265156 RepID=A0ABD3RLF1_9LAMI